MTTAKFVVKGVDNMNNLLKEAMDKGDALRKAATEFQDVINRISSAKIEIEEET